VSQGLAAGETKEFTVYMVRYPDVPDTTFSYEAGVISVA